MNELKSINNKIIVKQKIFTFEINLIFFEINKSKGIKKINIKNGLIKKTKTEKNITF